MLRIGQSASGTFVPDLNEREGVEKVGRNDARRTAAINYLRLESSHSAFGHFPPPGCFAPIPVAMAGISTPQNRTLQK